MRIPHRLRIRGTRTASAGVSLVVVLLALLVLGLIAVVAIPGYFDRHDVTLDNACRLLAHDLRKLQNRAALDKQPIRMAFDSDGWRALNPKDELVGGIGETVPIHRRFEGEGVFAGVVVESVELGEDQMLTIDARGLVSEHGEVELSFRGERRVLRIHRGSGDVAVAPER